MGGILYFLTPFLLKNASENPLNLYYMKNKSIKKKVFPNGRVEIEDKKKGIKITAYGTSDIVF